MQEVSLPALHPPHGQGPGAAGRGPALAEILGGEQDKVAGGQGGIWPSVWSLRRGQVELEEIAEGVFGDPETSGPAATGTDKG